MKHSTHVPVSHERQSSPDTSTVRTYTIPNRTSAILVTVETTAARITLDGTDPSAASAPSLIIPASAAPIMLLVGAGATLKHVSTSGAASVLQACYLS